MKTFNDLDFRPHPAGEGKQGFAFFPNGYGISVIRFKIGSFGYGSYTNNEDEWEIAVLYGDENEFDLTYNTPITNDVIGHLSESEVTEIMLKIQALPV
jgi:hypothetical protein